MQMSKIKFVSKYDYFLAILIITCCIFILLIHRSLMTFTLTAFVLVFGILKAFGKQITFTDKNIKVRDLLFKGELLYSDLSKVLYTTKLYGKSFITISTSKKNHKARFNYTEWVKLKKWIENKGIACEENR
jgi:hypothetical protein